MALVPSILAFCGAPDAIIALIAFFGAEGFVPAVSEPGKIVRVHNSFPTPLSDLRVRAAGIIVPVPIEVSWRAIRVYRPGNHGKGVGESVPTIL
jgi:hypothetical protein